MTVFPLSYQSLRARTLTLYVCAKFSYILIDLLKIRQLIAEGSGKLASVPSGGAGGGGAAAAGGAAAGGAAAAEEKEEEKEEGMYRLSAKFSG
jgi:hypothetical protein